MSYSMYIIYSLELDRYYTGYTEDISRRIGEHNEGISAFTSKASDWLIMYTEVFSTRQEAHRREMEIKKKKSRKYIEWLISSAG